MPRKQPERLTNIEYMPQNLPLHMYHQWLHEICPLHWHEFHEMSIILAGEGRHILNGKEYRLQPGSFFLLTPADFHEIGPCAGSTLELFNVIFSAEILRQEVYHLLFSQIKEYVTVCNSDVFQIVIADFRRLWSELQIYQLGQTFVVTATLERIAIDLARSCQHEQDKVQLFQEQHERLRNGLIYIHHHFREPLTLELVAQQVHLSPNYFSECFRKAYGASFQSYVQTLRLQFAMSLLSVANVAVTDICHASGFNTLSHFERAFKSKFGQSPRDVMQKSKQKYKY